MLRSLVGSEMCIRDRHRRVDAIAEAGATSPKDMGAVMKIAVAKSGGNADGKKLSALVREQLA